MSPSAVLVLLYVCQAQASTICPRCEGEGGYQVCRRGHSYGCDCDGVSVQCKDCEGSGTGNTLCESCLDPAQISDPENQVILCLDCHWGEA